MTNANTTNNTTNNATTTANPALNNMFGMPFNQMNAEQLAAAKQQVEQLQAALNEKPAVPSSTKKWVKRAALGAVVVGGVAAAHHYGFLDFFKSKFSGSSTNDSSVV